MTSEPTATAMIRPTALPLSRTVACVGVGAVLWLLAALAIRAFGAAVFHDAGLGAAAAFAVAVPVAWLLVSIAARAARLASGTLLRGVAVMAGTAMLLDGVALVWFPSLYALPEPALLRAAAWLLWGVALCLLVALVEDATGKREHR